MCHVKYMTMKVLFSHHVFFRVNFFKNIVVVEKYDFVITMG